MVLFFASLLRIFLQVFRSQRTIVSENALLRKENEILLRRVGKRRVQFSFHDKQIPNPVETQNMRGPVCRSAILGGLHHHYYRRAA